MKKTRDIRSLTGATRKGAPLSYNRQPAEDLRPWLTRIVVAKVEQPEGHEIKCAMFNDTTYARVVVDGNWAAETASGTRRYHNSALLFGPQTKTMPVRVSGPIRTIGVGFRAGALRWLKKRPVASVLDEILPFSEIGLAQEEIEARFLADGDPEDWMQAVEEIARRFIRLRGATPPDPITSAFDLAALEDPCLIVTEFAEEHGISRRQLERIVKRDFGMTPKKVLRRARVLDLASQMCGVIDDREEAEMALRFSDQSHLIREFSAFFGTTPAKFKAKPRPLLTLNLETRQSRRLEELKRLEPGSQKPWRDD